MKKLAVVSAITLGLLAASSTAQAKRKGRLSPEQRACMKQKGCYKDNRACHKATKGLRGKERKAAKKACRMKFRDCRRSCK